MLDMSGIILLKQQKEVVRKQQRKVILSAFLPASVFPGVNMWINVPYSLDLSPIAGR